MAYDYLMAVIILAIVVALLSIYVWIAIRIWRRFSLPVSLLVIAGASLIASGIWKFVGLLTILIEGEYGGTPQEFVHIWTFGLTGNLAYKFCEVFPQLAASLRINNCSTFTTQVVIGTLGFFLLGLLSGPLAKRKVQGRD